MNAEDIILPVMGLFIPIIAIVGGLGIALTAMRHQARKAELEHQERLAAIEKGIPLPPAMLPPARRRNPYIWGLILIGFGLAMMAAMIIEGEPDWGWGLVFMLPGVGILMANHMFGTAKQRENSDQAANLGR
jgi:hypothetical protein